MGKGKKTERIYLTGEVSDELTASARLKIEKIMDRSPGATIVIDINSPGGSVTAGLDLFGVIRSASKAGHKIITIASGQCASMAGVLVQAGDVRQIREHSLLHLHEAGAGGMFGGKAADWRDEAELLDRMTKQCAEIYAKRSTLTAEEIYDRMHRQEWWLSSAEALEVGFVDEVI